MKKRKKVPRQKLGKAQNGARGLTFRNIGIVIFGKQWRKKMPKQQNVPEDKEVKEFLSSVQNNSWRLGYPLFKTYIEIGKSHDLYE